MQRYQYVVLSAMSSYTLVSKEIWQRMFIQLGHKVPLVGDSQRHTHAVRLLSVSVHRGVACGIAARVNRARGGRRGRGPDDGGLGGIPLVRLKRFGSSEWAARVIVFI